MHNCSSVCISRAETLVKSPLFFPAGADDTKSKGKYRSPDKMNLIALMKEIADSDFGINPLAWRSIALLATSRLATPDISATLVARVGCAGAL